MNKQRISGFTLVELAIVMTIIGLLIGGILKGQQMIRNAQVTATIKEINSVLAATEGFRDKFAQLPGDMVTAPQRVTGCEPGNANFCENGNGDGIIGWRCDADSNQVGARGAPFGTGRWDYEPFCAGRPNVGEEWHIETTMFFKHLALSDFISGISPSADPGEPAWGETHLKAAVGGGYNIQHTWGGGTSSRRSGAWIRIQNTLTGFPYGFDKPGTQPLTPLQAYTLDQKMDDGHAESGYVMALSKNSQSPFPGSAGCGIGNQGTADYDTSITRKVCIMFVKLHGI